MEPILRTFITAKEPPYRPWAERYPDRQIMGYITRIQAFMETLAR